MEPPMEPSPLSPPPLSPQDDADSVSPVQSNSKSPLKIILLVVVILLFIGLVWYFFIRNKSSRYDVYSDYNSGTSIKTGPRFKSSSDLELNDFDSIKANNFDLRTAFGIVK